MPWRRHHRFWRHLVTDGGAARRAFPDVAVERLEAAIAAGERIHRGQVCLAIESDLPLARVLRRVSPRERALEVFGQLRIWDTEENCGVLVYLLLADRDVEIVADRGVHARVGSDAWEAVCRAMEVAFRERRYADGAEAGIRAINELLATHFPADGRARGNEIPNRPLIL